MLPAFLAQNGFVPGSRASLMMDIVAVGMLAVLPLLTVSLIAVRRRRYARHRMLQLFLAWLLAIVVTLFEVDVRLTGWRHLAEPSRYYATWLFPVLYVHLAAAISTSLLWIVTILHAVRSMGKPPAPSAGSRVHRRLGKAAAITMYMTAVTGWTFYYCAFIA